MFGPKQKKDFGSLDIEPLTYQLSQKYCFTIIILNL